MIIMKSNEANPKLQYRKVFVLCTLQKYYQYC